MAFDAGNGMIKIIRYTLENYVYLQGKNTDTNGIAFDYVRSP